ncbi:MAG: ECF transporter S component [Candidatus Bathyarchaeum sp.]|nr:MAG: ECF transporter S component [Candidatus Bathyarchaeum sp.]
MTKKQKTVIQISLMAVMSALAAVGTLIIQIPNGMGGYFNVGDVMIFVSALTFSPLVGGVAGGLGSALADALMGYLVFAPATLVIKGLEGSLAGAITNKKSVFRDVFAVVAAGAEMVIGYFLFELFVLQWGLSLSLAEIPMNIAQVAVGGLVGIPVALILRRRLPELLRD